MPYFRNLPVNLSLNGPTWGPWSVWGLLRSVNLIDDFLRPYKSSLMKVAFAVSDSHTETLYSTPPDSPSSSAIL